MYYNTIHTCYNMNSERLYSPPGDESFARQAGCNRCDRNPGGELYG